MKLDINVALRPTFKNFVVSFISNKIQLRKPDKIRIKAKSKSVFSKGKAKLIFNKGKNKDLLLKK